MSAATILVVDDSPSIRQTITGVLRSAGYQILEAVDGQDALDRLGDTKESIALAMVDINMPRLDGISLVRALRQAENSRYIPILILTAETRRERREEARKAGATGWIVKPFTAEEVLALVQRLLRR
jgi:two-component system chemotaxis response regulator CheY